MNLSQERGSARRNVAPSPWIEQWHRGPLGADMEKASGSAYKEVGVAVFESEFEAARQRPDIPSRPGDHRVVRVRGKSQFLCRIP